MPTLVGTATNDTALGSTFWSGDRDFTHTVPAEATVLMVTMSRFANDTGDIGSMTWDPAVANEALSLVDRTTSSGLSGDVQLETWALFNPTAKTATLRMNVPAGTIQHSMTIAYCYDDTATIQYIEEVVNDVNTDTAVYTGGGVSGNKLVTPHCWRGGNSNLIYPAPWVENLENREGSSSQETSLGIGDADAPQSLTITCTNNDENAGHMLQLIPGAGTPRAVVRFSDLDGNDRSNLSQVPWAWYDTLPTTLETPTDTGNGTTNATGVMNIDIPNSTLTAGQVGYLAVDTGSWQGIYAVTVI